MPAKMIILKPTTFDDFASLYRFLRSPQMRPFLTVGQAETIADVLDCNLPNDVSLMQRTPKGQTYLYLEDEFFGFVSPRAKFARPGKSRARL